MSVWCPDMAFTGPVIIQLFTGPVIIQLFTCCCSIYVPFFLIKVVSEAILIAFKNACYDVHFLLHN
jgi:hypothetical protein